MKEMDDREIQISRVLSMYFEILKEAVREADTKKTMIEMIKDEGVSIEEAIKIYDMHASWHGHIRFIFYNIPGKVKAIQEYMEKMSFFKVTLPPVPEIIAKDISGEVEPPSGD